jgi:hypothetical protein
MLNPDFVAALKEYVSDNNPQAFGLLVRSEIIFSHMHQVGKEQELSYLLDYLKSNFPENYFNASIQAITDFLLQKQFVKQDANTQVKASFNSICQSLLVARGIQNKDQLTVRNTKQVETARRPEENQGLRFEEIPSQKKIVEKRNFSGRLKVFASWYFIWNTIHQIALDLIVAIVICNMMAVCTNENLPLLRAGRTLLAACTSIAHINMRMNDKAKKRWKEKYG